MHPNTDDPSIEMVCLARVTDKRSITSSNWQKELRYIVQSNAMIGDKTFPIEISLTNRETMGYRMLISRSQFRTIKRCPPESFIQNKLSYSVYKKRRKSTVQHRHLRIGILTQSLKNYSNRRMIEAAEACGHTIETIYTSRCYMLINAHKLEVHYRGKPLDRYDAIISRIGASITFYGMAVIASSKLWVSTS